MDIYFTANVYVVTKICYLCANNYSKNSWHVLHAIEPAPKQCKSFIFSIADVEGIWIVVIHKEGVYHTQVLDASNLANSEIVVLDMCNDRCSWDVFYKHPYLHNYTFPIFVWKSIGCGIGWII